MFAVQVIVVRCIHSKEHGWSSYGDRLVDIEFSTLDIAQDYGETFRAEKRCVILRPKYNESDETGRFFREWRSFDGEDFKECRWEIGPNEATSCQPGCDCGSGPTPELTHS